MLFNLTKENWELHLICFIFHLSGCKYDGDYLPNNQCSYKRCTYGPEPWQDKYGNYVLYTEVVYCPAGSSVPYDFYGLPAHSYGQPPSPCSDLSSLCNYVPQSKIHILNYAYNSRSLPALPSELQIIF